MSSKCGWPWICLISVLRTLALDSGGSRQVEKTVKSCYSSQFAALYSDLPRIKNWETFMPMKWESDDNSYPPYYFGGITLSHKKEKRFSTTYDVNILRSEASRPVHSGANAKTGAVLASIVQILIKYRWRWAGADPQQVCLTQTGKWSQRIDHDRSNFIKEKIAKLIFMRTPFSIWS